VNSGNSILSVNPGGAGQKEEFAYFREYGAELGIYGFYVCDIVSDENFLQRVFRKFLMNSGLSGKG